MSFNKGVCNGCATIGMRAVLKSLKIWSRERESNSRPADYESAALPLSYLGQNLINSGDLQLEPREFRPYFVQKFPNTP
jgi:hypothetical protein